MLDEGLGDGPDGQAEGVAHHEGIGRRLAARVNTTVIVTGVHSQEGRSLDAKELEMDLVKADGAWVIQAVRPVEAMTLQ